MTRILLLTAGVVALAVTVQTQAVTARPYFTEPSISPDRAEIAFVSGGDIWAVPAGGGEARLLLSHPAHESRPMYSPDGDRLAFVSNRTGGGDIYLLALATGEVTRKMGLRFDRAEYENSGRFRVTEVIALSPAAVGGVKVGEYLLEVDGTPMSARVNLDAALSHKIGKRVELTLGSDGAGAGRRTAAVLPVNQTTTAVSSTCTRSTCFRGRTI